MAGGRIHRPPYEVALRLATAAAVDWAEIEGRMIRDGITEPFDLGLRQWLNVVWSYLVDMHGAISVSVERIPLIAGTELIPVGQTAGDRRNALHRWIEEGSHEVGNARREAMTQDEAKATAQAAPKMSLAQLDVLGGSINGVRGSGPNGPADDDGIGDGSGDGDLGTEWDQLRAFSL